MGRMPVLMAGKLKLWIKKHPYPVILKLVTVINFALMDMWKNNLTFAQQTRHFIYRLS